jgi:hypothetical protein
MAKRIIKLTESQLRQIVSKVINEQAAPSPNPAAPAAPATGGAIGRPTQEDTQISAALYKAVFGAGTDEEGWVAATTQIKDANQFWRINNRLEDITQEDYAKLLNGDFGTDDGKYVQQCVNHLKSIGIQTEATISGDNYTENSFKIVTKNPEDAPQDAANRQKLINSVYCSVKMSGGTTSNMASMTAGTIYLDPSFAGAMSGSMAYNGQPWAAFVTEQKPTDAELAAAKATCPESDLAKMPEETPRQKAISAAYCSVKGGKIAVPGQLYDGMDWTAFSTTYKPTDAELAAAKAKCPDSELAKAPAVKPKAQFTKSDDKFPLKYLQFGPKIGEMQKAMGMSGDTYFGNTTEAGVKSKAPEYKRETGVTEDIFNKIKAAAPTTATTTPAAAPAAPTTATPAAAPATPPPPTEADLQASPNTLNPY